MIAVPSAPMRTIGWLDLNQRFLAAELRRIAAYLDVRAEVPGAAAAVTDAEGAITEVRDELENDAAIDLVASAFGLTVFERDVLLLAAAVELDAGIAHRCLAATGMPAASFGLALSTLPGAHWTALLPDGPLRALRLVEVEARDSLVANPVRVAESVLHALAGIETIDPALAPLLARPREVSIASTTQLTAVERLSRLAGQATSFRYQLVGDDPDGQTDVAARAMRRLGRGLWLLTAADIPADTASRRAFAVTWNRDAALSGASLLVVDGGQPELTADFVDQVVGIVGVATRQPAGLEHEDARFELDRPLPLEQRELWLEALGEDGIDEANLSLLASQFRLSARGIWDAATRVVSARLLDQDLSPVAAARPAPEVGRLGDLGTWLEPRATWSHLVLPPDQVSILREIVAQVLGRTTVYESWGFRSRAADGLGIAALFEGDSGTGKTLAAEVVANELGLWVLRVDLASVVSKYIGETEKNIAKVFEAAEGTGAVILFDEAEALFGKRSEVRDSHDRYANIEVAYLLQRIESYRGLAILTSNAKSSIDRAFLRRLRFVVRFPFPNQGQREQIWRASFPAAAPTANLDFGKLSHLNLAGGDIRNIALAAAFLAAGASEPVSMAHLRAATRRELEKLGRPPSEADTRGWL